MIEVSHLDTSTGKERSTLVMAGRVAWCDPDAGILLRSSSAPATFDHPHPLERQAETRDLRYDPISLKEPQDLHSWDWLGCPARFINFALHKSVQEVSNKTNTH